MSILIKNINMPTETKDYLDIRIYANGSVKTYLHNGLYVNTMFNTAFKAPTTNVRENVHGEWLVDKYNAEFCSVCGKHPYNDGEYYVVGWDSDFCPHCGADMRGEKNE